MFVWTTGKDMNPGNLNHQQKNLITCRNFLKMKKMSGLVKTNSWKRAQEKAQESETHMFTHLGIPRNH